GKLMEGLTRAGYTRCCGADKCLTKSRLKPPSSPAPVHRRPTFEKAPAESSNWKPGEPPVEAGFPSTRRQGCQPRFGAGGFKMAATVARALRALPWDPWLRCRLRVARLGGSWV